MNPLPKASRPGAWTRGAALAAVLLALALLLPQPARSATGVLRGLVVLAQFPDVDHAVDREFVRQRFAVQLDAYVREMSAGAARLEVDVTPWLTLPRPVGDYRISPRNLEVDRGRVSRLIDDALSAMPPEFDPGRYDFVAVMLGATMPEYGMVGLCGYPGMLGWSRRDAFVTANGKVVRGGVAIFTSQAHLGTLFHDVAHILGGVRNGRRVLPCLYDHDLQARPGPVREVFAAAIVNMGYWDPMSCHFYKRELPPPGVSSWTRLRLGWLDEAKVATIAPGQTAEIILGPLEDPEAAVRAVRIPLTPTSFLLVENRQPIGFDRFLPGSGVLILRADDTVSECRHGKAPVKLVNADPARPRLEGAAFGAGAGDDFADADSGTKIQILEKIGGAYRLRISRP